MYRQIVESARRITGDEQKDLIARMKQVIVEQITSEGMDADKFSCDIFMSRNDGVYRLGVEYTEVTA